jgi:hypothetical protein
MVIRPPPQHMPHSVITKLPLCLHLATKPFPTSPDQRVFLYVYREIVIDILVSQWLFLFVLMRQIGHYSVI